LHWFVCSLHLNELPFRHLCNKLIGPTQSPSLLKGSIGKLLPSCELLPVSKTGFQAITDDVTLPDIDYDDISSDQAYLYKMIKAIRIGTISNDLLREKPGPLSHARWEVDCRTVGAIHRRTNYREDTLSFTGCRTLCEDGDRGVFSRSMEWSPETVILELD
jgi:hypothetical protein